MNANDQTASPPNPSVDPTYAYIAYRMNTVQAYASYDGSTQLYINGGPVTTPWGFSAFLLGYPAMAVFNDVLHLTHQSSAGEHQLFGMASDDEDAVKWSLDLAIPNVFLNESPGMAVFKDKLYVAHQGSDTTGEAHSLWYTTYDGKTWTEDKNIPGVSMNGSPSLAVFDDTLYILHQGSNTTGEAHTLWYTTTTDGITWTPDKNITGVSMDNSPSACATSGGLFVAYKKAGTGDVCSVTKHKKESTFESPWTSDDLPPIHDNASPTLYGLPGQDPDQVTLIYCASDGGQVSTQPFFNGE